MPSCLAIAAPVTTSSPVTIRTRMLAAWASRTASLDSARGGSIIPTIAVICRSLISDSRSPSGSKFAGSRSRMAATMTRRPLPPRRSISSLDRLFCSSPQGTLLPLARRGGRSPDHRRAGALDEGPHDGLSRRRPSRSRRRPSACRWGRTAGSRAAGRRPACPRRPAWPCARGRAAHPRSDRPRPCRRRAWRRWRSRNGRIASSIVFVLPAACSTWPSSP